MDTTTIEGTDMKLIGFSEGRDGLGTETANVSVMSADGNLYATHTSFRRGGCLYAGFVTVWNVATGKGHELDVTSRASDEETHLRYLIGLAQKHVAGEVAVG